MVVKSWWKSFMKGENDTLEDPSVSLSQEMKDPRDIVGLESDDLGVVVEKGPLVELSTDEPGGSTPGDLAGPESDEVSAFADQDAAPEGEGGESDRGDERQYGRGSNRRRSSRGRSRKGRQDSDQMPVDESEDDSSGHDSEVSRVETNFDEIEMVYDLDRGSPFRGSDIEDNGEGLPWRSRVTSAKEFFQGEMLYRYDLLADQEREALEGSYRVELKGNKGGVWTIFLERDISIFNRREDAEIVFTMRSSDFISMVNGDINPQLAILAKKISIRGDLAKALHFHELFAPARD